MIPYEYKRDGITCTLVPLVSTMKISEETKRALLKIGAYIKGRKGAYVRRYCEAPYRRAQAKAKIEM